MNSNRVDSVTVFNAHARPEPAPHRLIPTGLGEVKCAVCQRPPSDPSHTSGLRDEIGADATQCPGCEEIWPIEMTVRMMRFVRKDHEVLTGRNLRICQECAGMPVDDWALLALRRDKGWINEERYIERLTALAARTEAATPRRCDTKGRWGICIETRGHPGAHRYKGVGAQP